METNNLETKKGMKNCSTCGVEIAKNAKSCPQCGAKNKKAIYTRWWLWLIVAIVIFGVIGSSGGGGNETATPNSQNQNTGSDKAEEPKQSDQEKAYAKGIVVDFKELYNAYEENPIAADAEYKGKMLILTSEIEDIGRDVTGSPYITFKIDFLKSVNVYFDKSEEGDIVVINKGNTVTIVGKCAGLSIGSVIISGAYLIE